MQAFFKLLFLLVIFFTATGCFNRYQAPLIWENLPYPYVHSGLDSVPCKCKERIKLIINDKRALNIGRKLPESKYASELINDNVLIDVSGFLTDRLCTYFNVSGLQCNPIPAIIETNNNDSIKYTLIIDANIITPEVRGFFWIWALGLVELRAQFYLKNTLLLDKTYHAVAKDNDKDIALPWYAAVTFEMAGKLTTATSIKRIADSMLVDICDKINKSH